MLVLALTVAASLATQPPSTAQRCATAANTIALNECLAASRDEAFNTLERYRLAARKRLIRENPETPALPVAFDAAQAAWLTYKKHQCDAVFMLWQGGTIRGAMNLRCEIRMLQLRTREIWRDWLTYADSTPPVLPEPVVESGS